MSAMPMEFMIAGDMEETGYPWSYATLATLVKSELKDVRRSGWAVRNRILSRTNNSRSSYFVAHWRSEMRVSAFTDVNKYMSMSTSSSDKLLIRIGVQTSGFIHTMQLRRIFLGNDLRWP